MIFGELLERLQKLAASDPTSLSLEVVDEGLDHSYVAVRVQEDWEGEPVVALIGEV